MIASGFEALSRAFRGAFHRAHDAQQVAAVDPADVAGRVSLLEEGAREVGELRDIVQSGGRAAHAVEIAADPHVFHAGDLHHVIDMRHDIAERGPDAGLPALPA